MFEGAVAGVLNRLLGKYVQDLDTENLNVGIFSGHVNLSDLKLKPEALYELDLPIDVKIGTIGRINLQIPWAGLSSQPVIVNIEDVLILVGPAISNSHFDPEREKRLMRAAKRKILQDLEAESHILSGPQNFFENLFTAIVNNIQIYVRNVHIRYEDSISSKEGPMACGLCLQSLSVETTNSKWKPAVTAESASTVYQLLKLESLSLYWNPAATVLDDAETAHITPMQYYNWKHYMITGLDKFSMHHEDFDFLLKPMTCKVKVIINRSAEARVPVLLVDAVLQDSALQLARRQLLSFTNLRRDFHRISLNRKYRHLHPGVPLNKGIRKWWKYAYNAVLEQRVKPYTWASIKKHRDNYVTYKQTYKTVLRSPNDTELKLDLQKCEDSLPIESVVIAREQAKFELMSQEPDRIEVHESERDWWRPRTGSGDSDSTGGVVELCVRGGGGRGLWAHLSSPERSSLGAMLGHKKATRPKQYIEHKINLTLANCSVVLMSRSKEILVVTLTQFLASLETRPSANAYKLSARAESVLVEGAGRDEELQPLLTADKAGQPTAANFLALDFEKNPVNGEADYAVCCVVEPLHFVYNEHSIQELVNVFQTAHGGLCAGVTSRARSAAEAAAAHALARTKVFALALDVRGLGFGLADHRNSKMMIVDVGRVLIKSDLQPSNLTLEDATCMELEERLYDRLHAECTCQILFCGVSDDWREVRKQGDSDLHLMPRTKIQVVFSNSIKKDYKLLPRYKLNVSASSLKLNISDDTVDQLLNFIDNFPLPVPNTVPLSLLDEDVFRDGDDLGLVMMLSRDRVGAEPGYSQLVKLRHKIVAAHLAKNKSSEPQFDKESAKQGFKEADKTFVSSEVSDEEMEVYARSVDLPGFDDNVSPSNYITTLLRFIVGEVVLKAGVGSDAYLSLSARALVVDAALMRFGPALQAALGPVRLTDARANTDLLRADGDVFNLLYRKVRADCPDFRSHFHSVERSLVADGGHLQLGLHAPALRALYRYISSLTDKILQRHSVSLKKLVPRMRRVWENLVSAEGDPPVPPGATKFSYSIRVASVKAKLSHVDCSELEVKIGGLESEFVFRANDRMLFKLYLATLHVDDAPTGTLYPALVWPDEDKVLEVKYVRAAPRFYGKDMEDVKANGELRLFLGRLHIVMFYCVLQQLQQFLEPLLTSPFGSEAMQKAERHLANKMEAFNSSSARLNLVIEIHAPVLLLPQKPSSPNLLVLNMGDLTIENFFKQVRVEGGLSPAQAPVIDNVLLKVGNVTLARAVMTLAGTLQLQEPMLEPLTARCDVKRSVNYKQTAPQREQLLLEADVLLEQVLFTVGQQDLAAAIAVWADNFAEGHYMGNMVPSSPVEAPGEQSVKKLQEFFAQGDPVKKEIVVRFTLEGMEVKLFTDMDEILSSPVRDSNHGLARVTAGEASALLERYSDDSCELSASLLSLLVEDIRPEVGGIKSVLSSRHACDGGGAVRVRRPALLELSARRRRRHAQLDARLDPLRLTLAPAFLVALARALAAAVPGEKVLEGGVVNHGYVGETGRPRPPSTDSSGYYSTAPSMPEDAPSLTISVQLRQPEILFYTDLTKTEGHSLLLRTEVLIDYSSHSNTENFVVSLAGLQIMSKLQSKLKVLPPQVVLKPCDVEYSRCFKNMEEGIRVELSVSDVDVHLAATTVHTVCDIIEEITSELTLPEEKEPFTFSNYTSKEMRDDELWSPRKLSPFIHEHVDDYGATRYRPSPIQETFNLNVPVIKIVFELQLEVAIPVLVIESWAQLSLVAGGGGARAAGGVRARAAVWSAARAAWEPLLEPAPLRGNDARPPHITISLFQAKAYPISSKLEATPPEQEDPEKGVKRRRKKDFESETSADELDTDNEMTFIKNPYSDENKAYNTIEEPFLNLAEGEESDSENENGVLDKLASAIGNLFDESSDDDNAPEDDSSDDELSLEAEDKGEKAVSFADKETKGRKKEMEHKTVTLQEPEREDSIDSGLETESFIEKTCTYVMIECKDPLNFTITPQSAKVLTDLITAFTDKNEAVNSCIMNGFESDINLINDVGPGSTVSLVRGVGPAGQQLALAEYEPSSRPSTPGGDVSTEDFLEKEDADVEIDVDGVEDEWDRLASECCRSHSDSCVPAELPAPLSPSELFATLTDERIHVRAQDMDELTVFCPQRSCRKLHALPPREAGQRYYVGVETSARYNSRRIVVGSPLQLVNETSYPLEVHYKPTGLPGDCAPCGAVCNPFADARRLRTVPPHDSARVPLRVAHHCRLYLLPSGHQNYQMSSQGVWWQELAKDLETPRDIVCPSKTEGDNNIFAMRVLAVEGVQSTKMTGSIPNYIIRILPPLAIYNRLPYAIEMSIADLDYKIRIEAGERTQTHIVDVTKTHKFGVEMNYMGTVWTGSFNLTPDTSSSSVWLSGAESSSRRRVRAGVSRGRDVRLSLYAPLWVINKTGLPLQIKSSGSSVAQEVVEEPLLTGGGRLRARAHQSSWSRAIAPAAAPGLLLCAHQERHVHYRILVTVTLSELCPQLTKIVTFLPYFLVYNDTKRHLRFMEENEAADLWIDLAPQQCTAFWPQTNSMTMHCKFRDSSMVSQHFPITKKHFTVLRMDRGSAISVDVTGGTDRPFTITFKPYTQGDAPVRIENLCDDLFLKLHQFESGQVALLSPYQSMLYTWDDPVKDRVLVWNIYNNKGKGYTAEFEQDGYGEEKVSFHSVKHTTLAATNSVTSKLSSTLKRLTPRSPEPCSSSSDSDSSAQPDASKPKKVRKDKVIVYWVSYMDGYQRVFALTQDERIANQFRMKVDSETSNYELYLSLASLSLSVCVQSGARLQELGYGSATDSSPRWEVHVSHKWKELAPDLAAWLEDGFQAGQSKCQVRDYIHVDLDKMQMTKPFFSELRRTYNPGVWLQLRRSDAFSFLRLKVHRFQVDNQLPEAVFPSVLYPTRSSGKPDRPYKPSVELVCLKQHRASLSQDVYKYIKVLVQEHSVNLDRGFVNYIFDILNHWKLEEKPAVRLRADLALIHMPLPLIALKSQNQVQKSVFCEYVHLSPIKILLSLSSRGYSSDTTSSPGSNRFGQQKENRPKLFNSDLLEYLFNSWGSSLCDMKDVNIRLAYLQLRNAPITLTSLTDAASRHYWIQLVQQFYVLVLGLKILGNPYSETGDFDKQMSLYYEPHLGTFSCNHPCDMSWKLQCGACALLGQARSGVARAAHVFSDVTAAPDLTHKMRATPIVTVSDLPSCLLREDARPDALALSGLVAPTAFDMCRSSGRAYWPALCAGLQRSVAVRRRLPRHCPPYGGLSPYSAYAARGRQLLSLLGRGHFADTDEYVAHAALPPANNYTLLVSTQHIFMVRAGATSSWHVEWAVRLDDLVGVPGTEDGRLIINIKQDESVNYYCSEPRVVEVSDGELLSWLQAKVECALILGMEDKRCPPSFK